jgi:perosamine synthetase
VITLRDATMADADLLLEWANDPEVRRASVNSEPIDRETHVAWLSAKLDDAETAFYVCERDGQRIGYARAERRDDDSAELAVSVAREQRNGGIGRRLIALASARAQAELGVTRILARVKHDNASSLRAFESSGFVVDSEAGDLKHLELAGVTLVPHSRPFVGAEEAAAAAAVVASGNLAAGRVVAELEADWNAATGTAEAAAVGSGVAALRLALLALGVSAGDEVVVPAYSCVALLNAPLSLGATPVLADVELDAWTLSVENVARKVSPKTRAIVAVNLFGMPAPLAELMELGLPIVEDCAHGIGGRTSGGRFGAGSEVSMSSFYATKMLGAGEGGIVASKDSELVGRVRRARDYGDQLPDGRHLNDKLTDIEAAVARVQLRKLDDILREREARAVAYTDVLTPLAEAGLVTLPENRTGRIWYRYAVRLHNGLAGDVGARMATCGVRAEQPVWDLRACEQWTDDLEGTGEAFDRVVSLPLYPDLTTREQELVCDAFADAVRNT